LPDSFPPDSVIRRVNVEPALLFGAGRALLLQIAHPAVAQGVHEHSDFKANPFKRLQGTLESTYAVVFGTDELANGVGRRIRRMHDFVQGPGYRANDPANLLWVHATLLDTALRCYTDLVGPLSAADEAAYYEEMTRVAEVFGVPRAAQPSTLADFRAYFDEAVAAIEVSPVGRDLAAFIMDPVLPLALHVPMRPAIRLQRLFTVGTLPTTVREQFGFGWDERAATRLDRAKRAVRRLSQASPAAVRTAGTRASLRLLLRQAARHVAEFDARQAAREAAAA
jgi:uncharacterized protein (DUF2236 family)